MNVLLHRQPNYLDFLCFNMLGVNEILSKEEIPTPTIIALCESMLSKMEEPEMRRLKKTDTDRYYRTLKTQFQRLDHRYPGIFNKLVEYGRTDGEGRDIMAQLTTILQQRDAIFAKMKGDWSKREEVGAAEDKAFHSVYDGRYVRPVVGEQLYDNIMKNENEKNSEK